MLKMTPHDFVRAIVNGHPIDGVSVEGDINILNVSSSRDKSSLSDCHLTRFNFPPVSYNVYEFIACTIDTLELNNVSIGSLSLERCKINKLIIKSDFKGRLLNIRNNDINTIRIEEPSLRQILVKENSLESLIIKGKEGCNVEIANLDKNKEIDYIKFEGDLPTIRITSAKIRTIACESKTNNIMLTKAIISNQLMFQNSVQSHLVFEECNINELSILNATGESKFFGGVFGVMKFATTFSKLYLDKGKSSPNDDCKIDKLDLCNTQGCISIRSARILDLLLNNFTALPQSEFHFVKITSSLLIESSTIEKVKFHNVDLSKASIRFLNSSLAGSDLINVQWPNEYNLYEYSNDLKDKSYEQKLTTLWPLKESYRQLKVLSLDQHNKIDALAFQKHELKIYWRIVHIKTFNNNLRGFGNWLILFTNWIFSDFGQSIRRPIGWLLLFHALFMYGIFECYDLGIVLECDPIQWDLEATQTGVGLFLNLLSPVHSSEIKNQFMSESKSILGTLDFFMRISSGYFIYYFIRATRKYNLSV